jgi:capsular exopolysaccharide synthesis family protein
MSTILSGKNTIKECTRSTEAVNIDYITAGPVPPNPSELTMSLKMDEVLAELKEIYDIILIDTSPIGLVTDALNIFNKADFPIYVTKAGYSKRVYLHNINHLINDKNIKKLSVVLNGAEMYTSKYGYGYGYGYGNNDGYYYHDKTKRKARFSKLFLSNKTKH